MSVTVGLNQGAVMQSRMEEFLDSCGTVGIREVELRVPKLIEALYHMPVPEFQERLDRNGVTVTALNSMDDFALVPDDSVELLQREAENVVHLCRAARCDLVVAPVGRWFEKEEPDWSWVLERSAGRLEIVAEILGPAGIRVGVEPIAFPHFSVWSLEGSMEIIQTSGVDSAVLVADVYNLMAGKSTAESMRKLGTKIGMIHVNDAPHRSHAELDVMYTRRFPGEGVLSPADWVRAAWDGGFDGPISMEIFMKDLWEMDLNAAMRLCGDKAEQFATSLQPGWGEADR